MSGALAEGRGSRCGRAAIWPSPAPSPGFAWPSLRLTRTLAARWTFCCCCRGAAAAARGTGRPAAATRPAARRLAPACAGAVVRMLSAIECLGAAAAGAPKTAADSCLAAWRTGRAWADPQGEGGGQAMHWAGEHGGRRHAAAARPAAVALAMHTASGRRCRRAGGPRSCQACSQGAASSPGCVRACARVKAAAAAGVVMAYIVERRA